MSAASASQAATEPELAAPSAAPAAARAINAPESEYAVVEGVRRILVPPALVVLAMVAVRNLLPLTHPVAAWLDAHRVALVLCEVLALPAILILLSRLARPDVAPRPQRR